MKALFLGYGKMGSALGEAWLAAGLVDTLVAVDPGLPQGLRAQVLAHAAELEGHEFDVVVVAVKPAMAGEAIKALPHSVLAHALLISVMAGVTCADLTAASAGRVPVVRAMPNTPVMVGQGCSGLYSHSLIEAQPRARIQALFEAVGVAVWLDNEEQLHAVTALSGSGPAYYHLFSEALADAGIQLGLPAALAHRLAAHTALGAAHLQCAPDTDFALLRQAVTSPNGTTAAAVDVFENGEALRRLVQDAAKAASDRSVALSQPSSEGPK